MSVSASIVEIERALGAADRWNALAAAAGTGNPFYTPDIVAACRDLPDAAPVRLLIVEEGGRWIGALPIAVRRHAGVALCVENWDQRVRALGEPLVLSGSEAMFWRTALPVLARLPGHYLRLSGLDADSPSTRALKAVARCYPTRDYGRAVLHRGLSSAEHTATHVRGKVLKEHRRLRARLAERGALVFDRLSVSADVDPWIDDLFALEAGGWKGREGVAADSDQRTGDCFRTILHDAHARGTLDFHRMTVGGKLIAMLANLEEGDEAFQLKISYDEEWAAFSPGVLLEIAYLAYALDERKLARVDSCARAGHPMIDRIWPDRRRIVSLAVPFDRPSSRLICVAMDRWRSRRRPVSSEGVPA